MHMHVYMYIYKGKLRLSWFAALSSLMGAGMSGVEMNSSMSLFAAGLGSLLLAFSAHSLNQIVECNLDKKMERTKNRPLPSGRITKINAYIYASITGTIGCSILYTYGSPLSMYMGLLSILTYVCLYTPAKTRTVWNTEIGAFPGALPVVVGWTAAVGTQVLTYTCIYKIFLFYS